MKRFFLFAYLFFSTSLAFGQALAYLDHIRNFDEAAQVDSLRQYILTHIQEEPTELMKCVDYYLELPQVQQDTAYLYSGYYWKGLLYEILGQFPNALEWDFKALELAEAMQSEARIASCNQNIGLVYFNQPVYRNQAMPYYLKHLAIYTKLGQMEEVMGAYINIGLLYKLNDQIDSAVYYHRKALDLSTELESSYHQSNAYANLGDDFRYQQKWDSASYYYALNEQLCIADSNKIDLAETYYSMSFMHFERKDLDQSLYYLDKAIDLARQLQLQNNLLKYYGARAEVLYHQEKYKEAYHSQLIFASLNDSMNNAKTRAEIARLKTLYEVAVKDKQIEEAEAEQNYQKQRNRMIITIFTFITVLLSLLIFFQHQRKKKDMLLALKERDIVEAEMEKSREEHKRMEQKLEYKSRQLTSHALSMMQKNKILQNLQEKIKKASKNASQELSADLKTIRMEINNYQRSEKDWDVFKLYFEEINKDFYEKLDQLADNLSQNDYRLCALIKLNMNIKESASILNIAPNSVKSARYRLRKKLGLNEEDDLADFIKNISQ